MEHPLVSIIIPYYNGERFIIETLDSLLSQDYPDLEIIIVNDGSSESSLRVLDAYKDRITILHQKNKGIAAARNTGITHAHGSIIGMIDQDDLGPQGRLMTTLQALDGYDYVRGQTIAFEYHEDGSKSSSDPVLLPVLVGAALYRKKVFEVIGLLTKPCGKVMISIGMFD